MATLLDGINRVFKHVGLVQGDLSDLTSLTDTARQNDIDLVQQFWNLEISHLFELVGRPMPQEQKEGSITLVSGQREYDPPSDYLQIQWPMLDEDQGRYIDLFPGGFMALRNSQPFPENHEGVPNFAATRPDNGKFYLDTIPQDEDAGRIYKFFYDRSLRLTDASDPMPFNDTVLDQMVVVVAERWELKRRNKDQEEVFGLPTFRATAYNRALALAAAYLNPNKRKTGYKPFHSTDNFNITDPFISDAH